MRALPASERVDLGACACYLCRAGRMPAKSPNLMPSTRRNLATARRDRRFSVRVATRSDIETIADLDQNEYHDDSVDLPGLTGWFEKYSRGAFVLEYQPDNQPKRIVGALGIWPITADAFEQITTGQLDEIDIASKHICASAQNAKYRHWYVGDIIIDAEFRRKGLFSAPAATLLGRGLQEWLKIGHFDDDIDLCAIGVADQGGALLEHFGFQRATDSQHAAISCPRGRPVFKASIGHDKLGEWIDKTMQTTLKYPAS
jgi:hypothetical protein